MGRGSDLSPSELQVLTPPERSDSIVQKKKSLVFEEKDGTNWRQVAILVMIVFPECLGAEIARPFQYFFIKHVCGVEDGFLTGVSQAAFFGTFIFMNVVWGYTSDKIGRRPLFIMSALGNALGQVLFGMSNSFSMILISRLVSGFFACTSTIAKGMLGELSTAKTRGIAYAIYGSSYGCAQIVGPVLGGYLAEFPLGPFPYLLPCLVVAIIQILTVPLAYFCLHETESTQLRLRHHKKDGVVTLLTCRKPCCKRDAYGSSQDALIDVSDGASQKRQSKLYPIRRVCSVFAFNAAFWLIVSLYMFSGFITVGYQQAYNLMTSASVERSGLGFNTKEVSNFMVLFGLTKMLWQLAVFPFAKKFFSELPTHRIGMVTFIPAILYMPYIREIADFGAKAIVLGVHTCIISGVDAFCLLSMTCMITEVLPTERLAVGHAVNSVFVSLARSTAPMICGFLWEKSVSSDSYFREIPLLNEGRVLFFFLALVALTDLLVSFKKLNSGKQTTRVQDSSIIDSEMEEKTRLILK